MVNWIWIVEHSIAGEGTLFVGAYQTRARATACALLTGAEVRFGKAEFKETERARTFTQWEYEDHTILIRKVRVK